MSEIQNKGYIVVYSDLLQKLQAPLDTSLNEPILVLKAILDNYSELKSPQR